MKKISLFLLLLCAVTFMHPSAQAAEKKCGLAVANSNGNYTFYDLNTTDGTGTIEITENGSVMVPLKQVLNTMPDLKFNYNTKTKMATIRNMKNGKKVVLKNNSKYCYYYSNAKAAAKKKQLPSKMFTSADTSCLMVHMSALKYVFAATGGFQCFQTDQMQRAGYDTYDYDKMIVYNPYAKVSILPMATTVTGISDTVKVTIPEGHSVAQVINLLVRKGACESTDSLYDVINHFDYSYYPLAAAIPANEHRCFRLEGYLYPDTYEFYRLSKPKDIIGKFLKNAEAKITPEDRKKAESLGYSMDEILTIASLIEKEAGNPNLQPSVSSVIHNRLKEGMKLQLDASVYYVERYIKPYIDGDINRYNAYYNTRKCSALPAGPICNPGRNAIQAALNPAATDYRFFYSDANGEYHFSKDFQTTGTEN